MHWPLSLVIPLDGSYGLYLIMEINFLYRFAYRSLAFLLPPFIMKHGFPSVAYKLEVNNLIT